MRNTTLVSLLTLTALGACRGHRPNPVKDAFAATQPERPSTRTVVLRFSAARGSDGRVYQLPSLEELSTRIAAGRYAIESIVGYSADDDVAYGVDPQGRLIAIDLDADRTRVVDSAVARATVGPTGTTFAVHEDGSVTTVAFRTVSRWRTGFSEVPERMWAGVRDRLIGVVAAPSGRRLEQVAEDQSALSQPLPDGTVDVAPWGDGAAVATDSGIVVLDPADAAAAEVTPLDHPVRHVAYSASGHRLYAVDAEGTLFAFERFEMVEVGRVALPGPAAAVRPDARGERLLVRPATGDPRVWIVDLVALRVADTLPSDWSDDLPQATPDGTILARQNDEVVTFAADGLQLRSRLAARASDRWLVAAWDPREARLDVTEREVPEAPAPGSLLYVQVSSTSNEAWAADLAANLRQAGIPASVLPPSETEERFRVVLGPYATRDEAEAIRRRLNLPSWIFTLDTTQTTP